MDEVFVENVQFEIGAYHQVEIVLRTVCHARYLVRPGFFEEIDNEKLFTGQLRPDVNLLLIVTNECFRIRVE